MKTKVVGRDAEKEEFMAQGKRKEKCRIVWNSGTRSTNHEEVSEPPRSTTGGTNTNKKRHRRVIPRFHSITSRGGRQGGLKWRALTPSGVAPGRNCSAACADKSESVCSLVNRIRIFIIGRRVPSTALREDCHHDQCASRMLPNVRCNNDKPDLGVAIIETRQLKWSKSKTVALCP